MFMERDDFENVFYVVALSPDSRGIYTYSCLFQVKLSDYKSHDS